MDQLLQLFSMFWGAILVPCSAVTLCLNDLLRSVEMGEFRGRVGLVDYREGCWISLP